MRHRRDECQIILGNLPNRWVKSTLFFQSNCINLGDHRGVGILACDCGPIECLNITRVRKKARKLGNISTGSGADHRLRQYCPWTEELVYVFVGCINCVGKFTVLAWV